MISKNLREIDMSRGVEVSGIRETFRATKVVALGGGTGLSHLLRGLRSCFFPPDWTWMEERDRDRITAIVTVADDGGSSGRLRRAYEVLPFGDIRNCLLAISDPGSCLARIFDFRFNGSSDLAQHNLGNLILTALSLMERDASKGLEKGVELLSAQGRVLPATLEKVTLCAEFTDGTCTEGESRIAALRRPIRRVRLEPQGTALPEVIQAIEASDLVLIGPGSLYTSLIPVLLVGGIAEAIGRTRGRVVLVMNLMTEPGETDGYDVADHIRAIENHLPQIGITDVLVHAPPIPYARLASYAARGAMPVRLHPTAFRDLECRVIQRDLLAPGPAIRHDGLKTSRAALGLSRTQDEDGEV